MKRCLQCICRWLGHGSLDAIECIVSDKDLDQTAMPNAVMYVMYEH